MPPTTTPATDPALAEERQICDSLVEYWIRNGAGVRHRVYLRCEATLDHPGKHRNRHGKKWDRTTESGYLAVEDDE